MEINEVIDHRGIGLYRQTFYLARAIDGIYHCPYADRNRQLRNIIGDYRHKFRMEATSRKTHGKK